MENEIALSTIAKRVCETYERESDYTEKLNIGWLEVAIKGYLAAQSAMRVDLEWEAPKALAIALGRRGVHISFDECKRALQAAFGGEQ